MKGPLRNALFLIMAAAVAWGAQGCSRSEVRNETAASVNGEDIRVSEVREILGIRGGAAPAATIPMERKKDALDRLVAGRLLAQDARARGLDNTDAFRDAVARNEQGILITALFRGELEKKGKPDAKEIRDEAGKLRAADKNLSEKDAEERAGQIAARKHARKVEGDLIAAAKKDVPPALNQDLIRKIGKGEKVDDGAILGTAGGEKVSYADVKRVIGGMSSAGPHGGRDLSGNPMLIERIVDRELTGRALAAYARKQGMEGSGVAKEVRKELERSVLINLLAEQVVPKDVSVTDKEIGDAYAEHSDMFVQGKKRIPLSEVKERIREFLLNGKRKKALDAYIEALKKKAKITIRESALSNL